MQFFLARRGTAPASLKNLAHPAIFWRRFHSRRPPSNPIDWHLPDNRPAPWSLDSRPTSRNGAAPGMSNDFFVRRRRCLWSNITLPGVLLLLLPILYLHASSPHGSKACDPPWIRPHLRTVVKRSPDGAHLDHILRSFANLFIVHTTYTTAFFSLLR